MKYKNTKTGVIFDSPFVISGGNWEPLSTLSLEKEEVTEVKEMPEQTTSVADELTGNAEFDGITRAQIMQELDAFGVNYDKRANKQDLYDLMMNHDK